MAYYRVYLLNAADHIFNFHRIERDSDAAAVAAAAGLIADTPAVEIWAGTRRVAHLTAKEMDAVRAVASR